jgi:hypothetical protein
MSQQLKTEKVPSQKNFPMRTKLDKKSDPLIFEQIMLAAKAPRRAGGL